MKVQTGLGTPSGVLFTEIVDVKRSDA
jgi:hypothetical protein